MLPARVVYDAVADLPAEVKDPSVNAPNKKNFASLPKRCRLDSAR